MLRTIQEASTGLKQVRKIPKSYPKLSNVSTIENSVVGLPISESIERQTHVAPSANRKVFIVGGGNLAAEVYSSLYELPVERVVLRGLKGLASKLESDAYAVVFIYPMVGVSTAIKWLRRSPTHSRIPIHVVSSDFITDRMARKLYAKGVASVVAFPAEKELFASMLREMQKKGPQFHARNNREKRFAKALWARLRAVKSSMNRLKIRCHNGFVYITGKVSSAAQKRNLERVVITAPGVEKVLIM